MRTVIALDTSAPTTARIAVVRGSEVLLAEELRANRSHNALLFAPLGQALAVADPDVIAVGTGPGSYVGVRIAISAALGIAAVRKIPVVGLSSLLCLSTREGDSPAGQEGGELTVVGDARRGRVWVAHIAGNRMVKAPVPMAPDEARQVVMASSTPVATPDPVMPLAGVPAMLVAPSAKLLGQRVSLMDEGEFRELREQPVVPIYLAAPFVTTPGA